VNLTALTIAGSDPSGGAGLQADLKTFHQFGVYGMSVVTLLTVQNTRGVDAVQTLDADLVTAQLRAVLDDIPPVAAKTGALGSAEIIRAVADAAQAFDFPLVVDTVMVSKHGAPLIDDEAVVVLREELLPRALLVTPNYREAEALTGVQARDADDLEQAAARIVELGPTYALVKGGGLEGDMATDVLYGPDVRLRLETPRTATRHVHGAGCVLSAAITAGLAHGLDVPAAAQAAKEFATRAIATAPGLGAGSGPVNLLTPTPRGVAPGLS
jgi:hydroxymethylpyrimidine/phosphomethylpyrimidine kinase